MNKPPMHIIAAFFLMFSALVTMSCTSSEIEVLEQSDNPPVQSVPNDEPIKIEPEPVAEVSSEPVPPIPEVVPEPEPIVEVPAEQEPIVESTPEPVIDNGTGPLKEETAEYERSVCALSQEDTVSVDTFAEDKKAVLQTIEELSVIMNDMNYKEWLKYVSPSSKKYWSNAKNLSTISSRLPVKGLRIRSLEDYFKYIFIPSRLNRAVDEIRYISSSVVKAVQVNGNQDIIFYYFEKIDGKWLLKLDELES